MMDKRNMPVLVAAAISSFITPFMSSAINVALPEIGREFSASGITLGWITNAYLLISAMFLVPVGKIADLVDRTRIFIVGTWIFAGTTLALTLAPSAATMIALRAVQGFGGAMVVGTGLALLTSTFPPRELGKVLGINVAAVYLGLSVGPFVGGLLTEQLGWRSIFAFTTILAFANAFFSTWKLKGDGPTEKKEQFDLSGALLYAAAVAMLIYGFSSLPSLSGFWLMTTGILGMAAFVFWELRVPYPVLEIRLFRHNPVFGFSCLASLLYYGATWAVAFLLSLYLQFVKGLSPQEAGLVLLAQPSMMAILSPLAGGLSDRFEPRIVASLGMTLTCIAIYALALLEVHSSLVYIVLVLLVLGFGYALFSSPNANAIMSSVDRRFHGIASGTLGTMRVIGQTISIGITMSLIGVIVGHEEITSAQADGLVRTMKVSFLVFGTFCVAAIFASLARGKLDRDESSPSSRR